MHATTLLFVFIISVPLILSQHIFINLVPEYSALPSCAQSPLSSIVRDMDKGCGDGGATTSYSCFCTASSSYFSTLISTVVLMQCSESGQASSAVDVFDSYCAVGGVTSQPHPTNATATGSNSSQQTTGVPSSKPPTPVNTPKTTSQPLPTMPTTNAPPPGNSSSTSISRFNFDMPIVVVTVLLIMMIML
ncbi:hypothetical protein N431DRAFT_461980 [Stipitochalara longipes BDJ]|nr:hypothetical protein N431DRAFT_461980 [Stipitochalara longipes BDJ]